LRQIVINCYKFHGREDLLPAFTEEDEKANATATANANVSTSVGVLKMHSSGIVPTHKIQIQANGSPQIIAASPDGLSGSSAQVCLDPAGYSSDVDVCRTLYYGCYQFTLFYFYVHFFFNIFFLFTCTKYFFITVVII
jgi:hypothetical protein